MLNAATTVIEPAASRERTSRGLGEIGAKYADVVVWLVVAAAAFVLLERQHVPRTFFFDEWGFVFDRRSGGLDSWLAPHNGHLTLLPKLAYRIGFVLFGMDHYRPYRVMGLVAHVLVATMVYRYVRARQGQVVGVAFGTLFLLLGSGWEVIFQPFTINFMAPAAAGVIAWLALDRRSTRGDTVASVASGVALACGGLGVPLLLGSAARLAAERDWRRLVKVVVPPGALYALWYVAYGVSQGSLDNLSLVPRYVVDEAASSVAGLGGRDLLWGRLFLGVLIGIAVMAAIKVTTAKAWRTIPIAALAPAVAMLSNWLLVGYSRADLGFPASSRYVYIGALFVILVLADLVRLRPGRWSRVAVAVACILGIWGNWRVLHEGPVDMRRVSTFGRVELRAVEWAAATVNPLYAPDGIRLPGVQAGLYLDAVQDLGSAAATDGEVEAISDEFRSEVDRVSLEAGGFALAPTAPAGVAGVADGCTGASTAPDGLQVAETRVSSGGTIVVASVGQPVEVRLRRYADAYPKDPSAVIAAGESATIAMPADTAPRQEWLVDLRSTGDIRLCANSQD